MDTNVDFETRLVNCSYTCYAKSADVPGRYFPWDNVHFKTRTEAMLHLKNEKHENPDWRDRLVVVKLEMIVG